MTRHIIFVLIFLVLTSCVSRTKNEKNELNTNFTMQTDSKNSFQIENSIIICDSIYPNKNYRITLNTFKPFTGDETILNAVFVLSRDSNKIQKELYRDTIYNTVHDVVFTDFNNNGVKDILVQSYSDGRSNWTYYLYLMDTSTKKLKKVKGFETIKNPRWNSPLKLIENYVLSGVNWTSFYEIHADSIRPYNILVEDDFTDSNGYEREYNKAIKRIQNIRKAEAKK